MRTKILALAAAACFMSSAHAVVLFSDDFEGAVATPDSWATQQANPGSQTDNDPANTVGASFSAVAGNWFHYYKSSTPIHDIAVTSSSPGAYAGNNYLRLRRSGDNCGIAAAFRDWDKPLTTGILTSTWQQYVPDGTEWAGATWESQHLDNDHNAGLDGSKASYFFTNTGQVRVTTDEVQTFTFLNAPTITRDRWQEWTIVSNLDAGTYTLSIDGVTSAPIAHNFVGGGVTGLAFIGQPGQEYYIDNLVISDNTIVPEPGVVSLALVAGGMLLRRRHG